MELEANTSIVLTRRSLRQSLRALGRMINSTVQNNIAERSDLITGAIFNNGGLEVDQTTRIVNNHPPLVGCGAGRYILAVSGSGASCRPCFRGTFQPESGHFSCIKCPVGTYLQRDGGNSSSACRPCTPGRFQDETGKSDCVNCSPGHYNKHVGQTNCSTPCPRGTYSLESATTCTQCPPGTHGTIQRARTVQSGCKKCDIGTFAGQAGSLKCEDCKQGYATKHSAASNGTGQPACLPCEAGRFLDEGSKSCQDCEPGKQAPAASLGCGESSVCA